MRKNLLLLLCLLVSLLSRAQLVPTVISTAGGTDKNESIALDWVLGETFVETLVSDDRMVTQGFLQPLLVIEKRSQNPLAALAFNVSIAPNPVQSLLNIKISTQVNSRLLLTLTDNNGKVLISRTVPPNQISESINLSNVSNGAYVLQIRNSAGSLLKTFLVNKLR